jgi:hypothetical protein
MNGNLCHHLGLNQLQSCRRSDAFSICLQVLFIILFHSLLKFSFETIMSWPLRPSQHSYSFKLMPDSAGILRLAASRHYPSVLLCGAPTSSDGFCLNRLTGPSGTCTFHPDFRPSSLDWSVTSDICCHSSCSLPKLVCRLHPQSSPSSSSVDVDSDIDLVAAATSSCSYSTPHKVARPRKRPRVIYDVKIGASLPSRRTLLPLMPSHISNLANQGKGPIPVKLESPPPSPSLSYQLFGTDEEDEEELVL